MCVAPSRCDQWVIFTTRTIHPHTHSIPYMVWYGVIWGLVLYNNKPFTRSCEVLALDLFGFGIIENGSSQKVTPVYWKSYYSFALWFICVCVCVCNKSFSIAFDMIFYLMRCELWLGILIYCSNDMSFWLKWKNRYSITFLENIL